MTVQTAEIVEYTVCISGLVWFWFFFNGISNFVGYLMPKMFWYDTKKFDCEIPVLLEFGGNAECPFIAITPRSTQTRTSST